MGFFQTFSIDKNIVHNSWKIYFEAQFLLMIRFK